MSDIIKQAQEIDKFMTRQIEEVGNYVGLAYSHKRYGQYEYQTEPKEVNNE